MIKQTFFVVAALQTFKRRKHFAEEAIFLSDTDADGDAADDDDNDP